MVLTLLNILIIFELWNISYSQSSKWDLHGKPGDGYYLTVKIGQPPQIFNLLVDTGSSNLAVAGSSYPGLESFFEPSKSSTFINNGTSVKVAYTQGWWTGIVGRDYVQISSLKNLPSVMTDISMITSTNGFYVNNSHWQGILGLAYSEIAKPQGLVGSWFDTVNSQYPSLVNNSFNLELCGPEPYPNQTVHKGRFYVGYSEHSCPKSEYSTPIHHRWYYEVLVTGIKVGDYVINIPCPDFNNPKTIVDSGTSNLQLSSKSFYYVISELRMQTEKNLKLSDKFWNGKEEICFPSNEVPWSFFPSLTIFLDHSNGSNFGIQIPPNALLRPALNVSETSRECWLLGIEESHIGTVLGTVLLEGLCVVFDRKTGVITFAESSCGPHILLLSVTNKNDSTPCDFATYVLNGPLIAAIVILLLVLLPLGFAFIRWLWVEYLKPGVRRTNVPFISLDESNT